MKKYTFMSKLYLGCPLVAIQEYIVLILSNNVFYNIRIASPIEMIDNW